MPAKGREAAGKGCPAGSQSPPWNAFKAAGDRCRVAAPPFRGHGPLARDHTFAGMACHFALSIWSV